MTRASISSRKSSSSIPRRLKRNETVLIETFDVPDEMTVALVRAARKAGAIPFTQIQRARVNRELALNATERQLNLTAIHELARMKKMDAYIAHSRQQQHHRIIRRPAGANEAGGEENAAGARPAGPENEMGRAALADPLDGAARRDEHGGVRGFLFRRLHARLPQIAARA